MYNVWESRAWGNYMQTVYENYENGFSQLSLFELEIDQPIRTGGGISNQDEASIIMTSPDLVLVLFWMRSPGNKNASIGFLGLGWTLEARGFIFDQIKQK